jgi:hypothetical protein
VSSTSSKITRVWLRMSGAWTKPSWLVIGAIVGPPAFDALDERRALGPREHVVDRPREGTRKGSESPRT